MSSIAASGSAADRQISAEAAEIVARLERVPIGSFHNRARLIVGSCNFFDGFDNMAISFILPVLVPLWHIAPVDTGFLISFGFLGSLLGALTFASVAERWGRMQALILSVALFAGGSFLSAFAPNFTVLAALRILTGFGLGGELPVGISYINEFAHARTRGRFSLLYQFSYSVGMAAVALFANGIVPTVGWQGMFIIGALPAVVIIFLRMGLPESPRWLANNGRYKEADAIVTKIELESTKGDLKKLPPLEVKPIEIARTRWTELLHGVYFRRTVYLLAIGTLAFLCNFSLVTWAPTIYTSILKIPLAQALQYGAITQVVGLCGSLSAALVIDQLGRKTVWMVGFAMITIFLGALWVIGVSDATTMFILVTCGYFFVTLLSNSLNLYMGELYPTRMRALGASVAGASSRIASITGAPLVGLMLAGSSLPSVFLMFGGAAFIGFVIIVFFGIESKGKQLEVLSP